MNNTDRTNDRKLTVKFRPAVAAIAAPLFILALYFAIFRIAGLPLTEGYIRKIFVGNIWLWLIFAAVVVNPFFLRGVFRVIKSNDSQERGLTEAEKLQRQEEFEDQEAEKIADYWKAPIRFRLLTLLVMYIVNVTFSAIYYYPQQIYNTEGSEAFSPAEVLVNGQFDDSKFADALGATKDQGSVTVVYYDYSSSWLQKNQFKLKKNLGNQTIWVGVYDSDGDEASLNLQGTDIVGTMTESENNPMAIYSNNFDESQLKDIAGTSESIKTYPYAVRYVNGHVYKLGYITSLKVGKQLIKAI